MSLVNTVTVEEIDSISTLADPVLRNLKITQCYCRLSSAFAKRMGSGANWCTFATWASKQAGQTIRRQDFHHSVATLLRHENIIGAQLMLVAKLALQQGSRLTPSAITKNVLNTFINAAAGSAADAVARGNKKVFEEIAREFALFMSDCGSDAVYNKQSINNFCAHLQPGPPSDGQAYLKKGFTAYYNAFFESNPARKAQLNLFANLCVGFHEQNRLQPEIAEALNAPLVSVQKIKSKLAKHLFPERSIWAKIVSFFKSLFGNKSVLDKALESLAQQLQTQFRKTFTVHLMTLTFPPSMVLHLGNDHSQPYPPHFIQPDYPELVELLALVDTTTNTTHGSGASDWADLTERMHYIADLFRCYHDYKNLFDDAFTSEQVEAINNGSIPVGKL